MSIRPELRTRNAGSNELIAADARPDVLRWANGVPRNRCSKKTTEFDTRLHLSFGTDALRMDALRMGALRRLAHGRGDDKPISSPSGKKTAFLTGQMRPARKVA